MKVYIHDLHNDIFLKKFKKNKISSSSYVEIYSSNGLFILNNTSLNKLILHDKKSIHKKTDNVDVYIDCSETEYLQVHNVPINHNSIRIDEDTYSTSIAGITLIVKTSNDILIDWYFHDSSGKLDFEKFNKLFN